MRMPSTQKLSSRAVHPFLNQFFRFFSWILVDYPPQKTPETLGPCVVGLPGSARLSCFDRAVEKARRGLEQRFD